MTTNPKQEWRVFPVESTTPRPEVAIFAGRLDAAALRRRIGNPFPESE